MLASARGSMTSIDPYKKRRTNIEEAVHKYNKEYV